MAEPSDPIDPDGIATSDAVEELDELEVLVNDDFAALVAIWTGPDRETRAPEQAAAVIDDAAYRGEERRVEFASDLIASIVDDLGRSNDTTLAFKHDRAARMLDRSRQLEWPLAEFLAEARLLFWRGAADLSNAAGVLARLGELRDTAPPWLPATVSFWFDHSIATILANSQVDRPAEALLAADRAAALAEQTANDLYMTESAMCRTYIYLRIGDLETSIPVIDQGLAAADRGRWQPLPLLLNSLITLVLTDRYERAGQVLDEHQWLHDVPAPWDSAVHSLTSLVLARTGHLEAAVALAARPAPADLPAWVVQNRSWMTGRVFLLAGQADQAVRLIEEFFASAASEQLSPLDGTQLYAVLSEAREATGDAAGALQALRESQSHAYSWVSDSIISRLQAIQFARLSPAGSVESDSGVADRPDGDYVHYLTHDMRHSLQGVMGMISMLQLSNLDDTQRRYAELADASAQTLLALCNDVLNLAKINAGRLVLRPEPTDLAAEIGEVVDPVAVHCSSRGVEVTLDVSPDLPSTLVADPLRLKQVVLNLLTNASKYTTEGSITASLGWTAADADSGELRVAVADTGPGIPPDVLPTLFDEFAQVDTARDAAKGGSGLGLAIAGQLVRLMGGQISIDSTVGVGTTFSFTVPLDLAAAIC